MSGISIIVTAITVIFNLITGAAYQHDICPPQTRWQWYPAHGIWACGGEQE